VLDRGEFGGGLTCPEARQSNGSLEQKKYSLVQYGGPATPRKRDRGDREPGRPTDVGGESLGLPASDDGDQPVNEDVNGTDGPDQRRGPFQLFDQACDSAGPEGALDAMIAHLTSAGLYRELLDALLLKARHELGLALVTPLVAAEIPEPVRSQYEEKYVAAIRLVGGKYLEQGDIPTAWAYFRAIGETEPVAQAVRSYKPAENDERLGTIIEIAFNHGVDPARGFDLILENYGTCPAISALEQLPPHEEATRMCCAERLIRRLHDDLTSSLRSDIAGRGQPLPPAGTSIAELVRGRPWLFADDGYHIDISHLAAVVRA